MSFHATPGARREDGGKLEELGCEQRENKERKAMRDRFQKK